MKPIKESMPTELEEQFFEELFGRESKHPEKIETAKDLLFMLKNHHPPTYEHSLRVGLTTSEINKIIFLNPETGLWGALHDIGKIKIPVSLLDKTTDFDDEDMRQMRLHTSMGYGLLKNENLLFSAWIALTHHRYQGNSSYPSDGSLSLYPFPIKNASAETRLTGDETARIVSLADTYDASHRANGRFGKPLTRIEIKEMMLKNNQSRQDLIEELYRRGTFKEN